MVNTSGDPTLGMGEDLFTSNCSTAKEAEEIRQRRVELESIESGRYFLTVAGIGAIFLIASDIYKGAASFYKNQENQTMVQEGQLETTVQKNTKSLFP